MELREVDISNKSDLEFIERIYIESFPPDERRPVTEFLRLVETEVAFTVCLLQDDNERIGFLTYWSFESFIYAEHFAISPEFRSGGYGKQVMEAFISETTLPLILEVELPQTSELAKRRVSFYERIGFKLWDIPYEQPPYEKGYNPLPMMLMTYREILLDKNFEYIRNLIYNKVYGVSSI